MRRLFTESADRQPVQQITHEKHLLWNIFQCFQNQHDLQRQIAEVQNRIKEEENGRDT
jgi:hypothetical protein